LSDGTLLILDAGSGIRPLGAALGACDATLLLSHYHWDHIQGLPFFSSAFLPESRIQVFGPESTGKDPRQLLGGQMVDPYFPAPPSQLVGIVDFAVTPDEPFRIGNAVVRKARLSHPGLTFGYRIEEEGRSFVYISDNEVDVAPPELLEDIIDLAQDADLLLHDCQFTEAEYPSHRGWGHSTPRQAIRLASEADVEHLVLFHHDPAHSDEQVEALAEEAYALAGGIAITIAREGESVELPLATPELWALRREA
jgi:phosphoribosyl 1,2-cyclic phosphodiesterase